MFRKIKVTEENGEVIVDGVKAKVKKEEMVVKKKVNKKKILLWTGVGIGTLLIMGGAYIGAKNFINVEPDDLDVDADIDDLDVDADVSIETA